jgi:uncharacterized membrane protein YfhO
MLDQVDLDHVAVIDVSKFNIENVASDTTATIRLLNYQPNKLQYESNSQKEVLAVFSEIYYPKGWKAFIDDTEVEIIRANYILRALKIPAGNHKIEFRFEPKAYSIGNTVMWISSLLLLTLVIVLPGKKLIFDKNN